MGFSCKGKNSLLPMVMDNLNKDLGLSNIYNVNTDVGFCFEKFNSPLYYISGATKPTTNIFSGCTDSNGDGIYSGSIPSFVGCLDGFDLNPEEDGCISTSITGATSAATFYTVGNAPNASTYTVNGTNFYEEITNLEFPIQNEYSDFTFSLVDATNDPLPYPANLHNISGNSLNVEYIVNTGTYWHNPGNTVDGRLNPAGVWANPNTVPNGDFIGFSKCIDILTSGLYHIGVAADNYCRVKLNGETIVVLERSSSYIADWYETWHVFPITLNSGKNILEMEGAEYSGPTTAFAAEIYSANTATLTAATNSTESGTIFTTEGLSGEFEIGDNSGFICPSGYALDTCLSGTPFCTQIIHTGLTLGSTVVIDCSAIYNTSVTDSFDLIFNITGGTDYTGYTGQFCYEIFSNNISPGGDPTHSSCIDYSGITSSTVTATLNSGTEIPISSNDYRILTYDTFTAKNCGTDTINTKIISDSRVFDFGSDWYFRTVSNPPTPIFTEIVGTYQGGTLVTDILTLVDGQSNYPLTRYPNGNEVIVNVNGITITRGLDYTLDDTFLPSGSMLVDFSDATNIKPSVDNISVTYITHGQYADDLNGNSDLFSIESLVVTGVTSGVTASTVNILNYNITENIHEFFTQYDILDGSNIVLSVDGFSLIEGLDYFRSNKISNKINILSTSSFLDSSISVFYFKQDAVLQEGNLGKLDSNDVNIQWYIAEALPTDTSGYFDIEITEESDITYSATTYTGTTEYVEDVISYGLIFEDVEVNKKYIYRVCMSKTQTTITDDDLTTSVCSANGSFDLTSGTAIYNNI